MLATDTRPTGKVHAAPRSGDGRPGGRRREGRDEGETDTEQQGRLDTLIFLVKINSAQKSREGVEMLGDVRNCSVDHVCVPSSVGL